MIFFRICAGRLPVVFFILVISWAEAEALVSSPVALVDDQGRPVDYACAIPLYRKIYGFGFGVDAKGSYVDSAAYMLKPYRLVNGDDFLAGLIKSDRRVIPIPPIISYGEAYFPAKLLVLRRGYLPVLEQELRRQGKRVIVLQETDATVAQSIFLLLQEKSPNMDQLKFFFRNVSEISLGYSDEDRTLLRECFQ